MEGTEKVSGDVPVLSVGLDRPDQFQAFPQSEKNLKYASYFFEVGLENLKEIEVQVQEVNSLDLPVLVVEGDHYAAEKLLDPDFMRSLAERLNASLLAASVPRRGTMLVCNGLADPAHIGMFKHITSMKFQEDEPSPPISDGVILVEEGKLVGVIS